MSTSVKYDIHYDQLTRPGPKVLLTMTRLRLTWGSKGVPGEGGLGDLMLAGGGDALGGGEAFFGGEAFLGGGETFFLGGGDFLTGGEAFLGAGVGPRGVLQPESE